VTTIGDGQREDRYSKIRSDTSAVVEYRHHVSFASAPAPGGIRVALVLGDIPADKRGQQITSLSNLPR